MTESKEVYLLVETSGVGQLIEPVAAYRSKESADRHVKLAKMLMPAAANRLAVRTFDFNDEKLP